MNHFIRLSFLPHGHNLALLLLRVFVGASLFLRHGMEKILSFSQMAAHFPDPLHIGGEWSMAYAFFCDAFCSLFLIIGLGTRWAALFIAINTTVAFLFVHRMHLGGERPGELAWLYLAAALTLFFAGAGKYSIDHGLMGNGGEHHRGETRNSRRKFKAAAR
jgi:putative oxidoreductase